MKTAALCSIHGKIEFDVDSGFVTATELDSAFTGRPYKIDVDEWRLRYPGEDMEGEHNILDFGYWYYRTAKNEQGKRRKDVAYEPPCEDWRKEREEMIAQDKEEL